MYNIYIYIYVYATPIQNLNFKRKIHEMLGFRICWPTENCMQIPLFCSLFIPPNPDIQKKMVISDNLLLLQV